MEKIEYTGDGPWCSIPAGELPTGDGIACGRYAPNQVRIDESGETRWVCDPCVAEFAEAPDRNWTVTGRLD